MQTGARLQAAIELLDGTERTDRPADAVIGAYFKERRYIGAKDRGFIAEQAYGVMRRLARLDWWLDKSGTGVALNNRSRLLAAMSFEGRSSGEIATWFTGEPHHPTPLNHPERALLEALNGKRLDSARMPSWVRFEYPPWLHDSFRARFGQDLETEMTALNQPAPVDLRVNLLKGDRDKALAHLAAEGIAAEPTALSPLGIRLAGRPPLPAQESFRSGLVEVQDEGSQVAALLVAARPGMRVVDFCAGAGGKTLAMAAGMENRGHVLALDISAGRMARSAERLRRAGIHNVERRVLASERDPWVKHHKASFDRVLIDAPCSGTGTWRRNPDARWRLGEQDLAELTALQSRILDSACRLVRPGGRLVYVTCALLAAENQAQAEAFLATHTDFRPLPVAAVWAESVGGPCPADGPTLSLTPARHGTDGFFVAIFERASP